MFNNVALDVFIGLVFVFLLYSLLATIVQEFIATRLAFRAKVLEKAILRMLEDGKTTTKLQYGDRIQGVLHLLGFVNLLKDKKVAPWFYAHPLIKYLAEDNYYSKPAYLDASNFSKVMIDLLKGFDQPESQSIQSIHNSITAGTINKLPINISNINADGKNPALKIIRKQNPDLPDANTLASQTVSINPNTALFLRSLWQECGADIEKFRTKLEQWFDDTMERATGWYKRYTRTTLFLIGLMIAYVFNVDTIAIHRILSKDKNAREQLVQMATADKDKYSGIVEQIRVGNTLSDTILKETFKSVKSDAESANAVLGLGKPWLDTIKLWSYVHDYAFDKHLDSLKRVADTIADSINTLNVRLIKNYTQRDTTSDQAKKIHLLKEITTDSAALKDFSLNALEEYQQTAKLKERCEYVYDQRQHNPFAYSPYQSGNWLEVLLGWLITALAITLGAPFWFDLLSKLVSLRGTGNKIISADDDKSKLSQASSTAPVTVTVNSNSGEEAVG